MVCNCTIYRIWCITDYISTVKMPITFDPILFHVRTGRNLQTWTISNSFIPSPHCTSHHCIPDNVVYNVQGHYKYWRFCVQYVIVPCALPGDVCMTRNVAIYSMYIISTCTFTYSTSANCNPERKKNSCEL